jgi:hypothetical protein
MKLLRPLAGHTVNVHKRTDPTRCELQTECILDKIDEYRRNWLLHLQRMPHNRIPLKSYHYSPQGKRIIGRPKGESSCNSGDGKGQMAQPLVFMMMMILKRFSVLSSYVAFLKHFLQKWAKCRIYFIRFLNVKM